MPDAPPKLRSPKQPQGPTTDWYGYYAGYTVGFVEDALGAFLPATEDATVLDPWNGSGTTSATAARRGIRNIGLDLNPALVLIARGRHLAIDVTNSLGPLSCELIESATNHIQDAEDDPLLQWFDTTTASWIRSIERSIHRILVDEVPSEATSPIQIDGVSTLAAFFYCALFLSVRDFTQPFRTSNPTWIKTARSIHERLAIPQAVINSRFQSSVDLLSSRLTLKSGNQGLSKLSVDSATNPSLAANKVDLVLGSPPYCTRIDYVIATLPELAVLGFAQDSLRGLRQEMHGTPLVRKSPTLPTSLWGPTALGFLEQVDCHASVASKSYYALYFQSYFSDLRASILNLYNTLKDQGMIGLVVQDSYYKEHRIDLASIVQDMGEQLGMQPSKINFRVPRTMASINPASKRYRVNSKATETLVLLKKEM